MNNKGVSQMRFNIDMHTHSIASGHAYSTIEEMAKQAKKKGIEMFALTDHGPSMPGSQNKMYFDLLPRLPKKIEDVEVLKGIEVNILNEDGELDLENRYLKSLDIVIASLHDICYKEGTERQNTRAIINALKNPFVDIIGHIGNPVFKLNYEEVINNAKKFNKLIELNNSSVLSRQGSLNNCKLVAQLCKSKKVRIVCGSDSHVSYTIGEFNEVYKILEAINMPEELIVNSSKNKVYNYLSEKRVRLEDIN